MKVLALVYPGMALRLTVSYARGRGLDGSLGR